MNIYIYIYAHTYIELNMMMEYLDLTEHDGPIGWIEWIDNTLQLG